ncbi:hypothetical protein PRIPAC_80816, partial [Pristionchus pacificus]|uniref:Uncharacterized protein n=1 Tax=Pristionchus pacificus TaxID=54126 RepID=A0A2A6BX10_PRIPA
MKYIIVLLALCVALSAAYNDKEMAGAAQILSGAAALFNAEAPAVEPEHAAAETASAARQKRSAPSRMTRAISKTEGEMAAAAEILSGAAALFNAEATAVDAEHAVEAASARQKRSADFVMDRLRRAATPGVKAPAGGAVMNVLCVLLVVSMVFEAPTAEWSGASKMLSGAAALFNAEAGAAPAVEPEHAAAVEAGPSRQKRSVNVFAPSRMTRALSRADKEMAGAAEILSGAAAIFNAEATAADAEHAVEAASARQKRSADVFETMRQTRASSKADREMAGAAEILSGAAAIFNAEATAVGAEKAVETAAAKQKRASDFLAWARKREANSVLPQ